MKRTIMSALLLAGALVPFSRAEAANIAAIINPPTFLNLLVLVGAVVCTAGAVQVFSLVRGGRLSRCWQWFIGGFAVLALAEIILLCGLFELLTLLEFVVPTLLLVMAGLFLYGVREIKRTLS